MQMILWSIVAASQYALKNRTGFLVCRSLLAILQGGFIPDVSTDLRVIENGSKQTTDDSVPILLLHKP